MPFQHAQCIPYLAIVPHYTVSTLNELNTIELQPPIARPSPASLLPPQASIRPAALRTPLCHMAAPVLDMEENHVLLVSVSAQGHINPMVRLGKLLLSKGLHVTLAITETKNEQVLRSSGIDVVFFSDGMSQDHERKTNLDLFVETLGKFGPINLLTLIRERYCDGKKKLRCLIANNFVPWVADVALELGIPCALLWIQPCALYVIYDSFYNERDHFPSVDDDPDVSVELPGLPLLATKDLPSFVLPTNRSISISRVLSELFRHQEKFKWVLGNSFYELEKGVIDSWSSGPRPIWPIGPLVPPVLLGQEHSHEANVEMWKPENSCIEWLDQQERHSVIYISFGSVVVLPAKQMESIAVALKNSKRPFLWVVKPPEVASPDGAGELPLGFIEETGDQGRVVTWSPQTRVLAHPASGCFVTHCGWNSMLETIPSGIPLIAYPQWTDQPTNAKLITDAFKIGVRLYKDEGGTVTSDEIEKCIEEVMAGPRAEELRNRAEELKQAAREAAGPGGSSDRAVQQFVDEVIIGDYSNNDSAGNDGHSADH